MASIPGQTGKAGARMANQSGL